MPRNKTTDESIAFGEYLTKLRGEMSAREVSRLSHIGPVTADSTINPSYLRLLERGADVAIGPEKALALARIYQVRPEEFASHAPSRYRDDLAKRMRQLAGDYDQKVTSGRRAAQLVMAEQAMLQLMANPIMEAIPTSLILFRKRHEHLEGRELFEAFSDLLSRLADFAANAVKCYEDGQPIRFAEGRDAVPEIGEGLDWLEANRDDLEAWMPAGVDMYLGWLLNGMINNEDFRASENSFLAASLINRAESADPKGKNPLAPVLRRALRRIAGYLREQGQRVTPWTRQEFMEKSEEEQKDDRDLAPPELDHWVKWLDKREGSEPDKD